MAEIKRRFTIGVLVSGIMDDFTRHVCRGVIQKAKMLDVDIIILPGKYWERDLSDNRKLMYEYQYNTIFSYACKETVDALIIAVGSIGCFADKDGIERLLKKYKEIPSVLLGAKMNDYPNVMFDNYEGIKQGLGYLIEQKKCKRFGMIGGSQENTDALERKKAFITILEQHGIKFHEKMYVEGDLSRRCEIAYKKLLDDNPDIEAIFCVNDDTAIGLYDELKRRGLKPGKDVAVFGYDDTIVASKVEPLLSSVRADASLIGEEALLMAVEMAKGEKVESRVLPTQFIIRDSVNKDDIRENGTSVYVNRDYKSRFDEIFYRYCHDDTIKQMDSLHEIYIKLVEEVIHNTKNGFSDKSAYTKIMSHMDEFLNLGGVKYADVVNLLNSSDELYRILREKQPEKKGDIELRDVFFHFYKKIIRAMSNQMGNMDEKAEKESYDMKIFVQEMFQFENGKDQSYSVILENLDWLNIKNAKIYMFHEPILHLSKEDFEVPAELLLKAELIDGEARNVSAIYQKRKVETIFKNYSNEKKKQVLLPLFFNEMLYGIMLCDMTDNIFTNGEFLVNQISSAVKMLSLLEANEKIQIQLEENLAVLKEHNIELDTISKSDVLTGILNRRGFYDVAQDKLDKWHADGKNVLAIYVDMNNLKIINDRYGHEEGDFSLKLIGEFLKEMVHGCGVAGRIGGDEYACVMEYSGENEGLDILLALYEQFEKYNLSSEKPYNITVSAGACVIKKGDEITLKDALLQADEKLYEVKQHRKKDVVKTD